MKRILSVSGGGIRGLLPAIALTRLEQRVGKSCAEIFDLVAGTSTGGIIACAIGAQMSMQTIWTMYSDRGSEIFSRPWYRSKLLRPRYAATGIDKVLADVFGAQSFESAATKLLIPAYNMHTNRPVHYKTWDRRDEETGLTYSQVCRRTSAAPTYFPAAEGKYVDGGVFANNPSMNAITAARKLWPGEALRVLSLGTGRSTSKPKAIENGGLLSWMSRITSILFETPSADVEYMADVICSGAVSDTIAGAYLHVDLELPATISAAMDDTSESHLQELQELGVWLSNARSEEIKTLLRM